MLFKKKKTNSSIDAMTISADIIHVNNEYGHYEVGDNIGKTITLKLENYTLEYKGGILVGVKEEKQ